MTRTPTEIVEVEFGEDTRYAPPTGADRWTAFRRTDTMPAMSEAGFGNPTITYGGEPPTWAVMGGWNIATDQFIPLPEFTGSIAAPSTGFEHAASAAGFAVDWNTLASATASGLREALMVIAYVDGAATHKTVFRVPAASAIDPTVIAAQERRHLMSLLQVRDRRAGAGGVIKLDRGEDGGEEFESLAVLDRRIAECRARIAWFEQAANGNDLPGAGWAGLSTGTDRTGARTTAAAPPPPPPAIMRFAFTHNLPFTDDDFRWLGTVNSVEIDSTWQQPSAFGFWIAGPLTSVVAFVQLQVPPGTVTLTDFGPPTPFRFGDTAGFLRATPLTFVGDFNQPNAFRAVLA